MYLLQKQQKPANRNILRDDVCFDSSDKSFDSVKLELGTPSPQKKHFRFVRPEQFIDLRVLRTDVPLRLPPSPVEFQTIKIVIYMHIILQCTFPQNGIRPKGDSIAGRVKPLNFSNFCTVHDDICFEITILEDIINKKNI